MKQANNILILLISLVFVLSTLAFAINQDVYPIKGTHEGGDIRPSQAFEIIEKDPKHTFLVDVRTRYEYQDIGHPVGAYNVPYKFYTSDVGKKGYHKVLNKNFCGYLKERFNPETDTLLLLCRSAKRTIDATTAAVECGFKEDRVFSIMGGFEGDKIKDKNSPFYGKRMISGWRIEGLPWTYAMDSKLMYQADLKE